MKERAGDVAAPPAGGSERTSSAVGKVGQRLVVSAADERRIVEFVAAPGAARWPDRAVDTKPGRAIAEMQLALSEARRVAEQSRHGVADAIGVLEAFAEHHVAAALAVHPARGCELREPGAKSLGGRKRSGVQLRIAARQPAAVAARRWRLVGERREPDDLGAGAPPSGEDVRIDEREGRVGGERDALAGRRWRW